MLRYCITDRSLLPPQRQSLDALLARILHLAPHIDFLQIRERDLSAAALEQFTARVLSLLAGLPHSPRVLINHRADIAIASALASSSPTTIPGVHLRSGHGELTPAQIRDLYSASRLPSPLISVSCHTLDDVRRASVQCVDLILFGPVFEKAAASLPGSGLDLLRAACLAAAPTPVLALGGVTAANTPDCLAAGAAGIAAIRLFLRP
jgi:thiamine-phosphate pyrophosphorylase